MVFNNVYEMITRPAVLKKSWFVDYFDGDDIKAYWTFTDHLGTGSSAMVDAIDGGFAITTDTGTNNRSSINFNNIRHHDMGSCWIEIVSKFDNSANATYTGLGENGDFGNSGGTAGISIQSWTAQTNFRIATSDSTTFSSTSTGVALDANFHRTKLRNDATNGQLWLDGILKVTKTTNLPNEKGQPFFKVQTTNSTAAVGTIRYFEVYAI